LPTSRPKSPPRRSQSLAVCKAKRERKTVKRFCFLDLLFPPSCVGCGIGGVVLCERCIAPTGKPLRFELDKLSCVALGSYDGILRRSILRMKQGRRDICERLGALLAQRLGAFVAPDACLSPVPTTLARRAERGFDQAALLARSAACELGRPVLPGIQRVAGPAQHGRTRKERLEASGRFALLRGAPVQGANIVLVDDVATTGATLREAAAVFEAGGGRVRAGLLVACAGHSWENGTNLDA
jgi:predicted amidophosphoribosyltransferase